jgi:hypothetical protein
MRNMWKLDSDPSRCDRLEPAATLTTSETSVAAAVITAPTQMMSLLELARRKPSEAHDYLRETYTITHPPPRVHAARARDMTVVQDNWFR